MANEKIEVGYRHIGTFAVLPITLSLIFLSACEASNYEKHSEVQQSTLKGKVLPGKNTWSPVSPKM